MAIQYITPFDRLTANMRTGVIRWCALRWELSAQAENLCRLLEYENIKQRQNEIPEVEYQQSSSYKHSIIQTLFIKLVLILKLYLLLLCCFFTSHVVYSILCVVLINKYQLGRVFSCDHPLLMNPPSSHQKDKEIMAKTRKYESAVRNNWPNT
jgi:hypothetical protein